MRSILREARMHTGVCMDFKVLIRVCARQYTQCPRVSAETIAWRTGACRCGGGREHAQLVELDGYAVGRGWWGLRKYEFLVVK
jgi:hypothetical protein